jgi:hypothetical protein
MGFLRRAGDNTVFSGTTFNFGMGSAANKNAEETARIMAAHFFKDFISPSFPLNDISQNLCRDTVSGG